MTVLADLPVLADAPEPNEPCDRCIAHAVVAVQGTFGRLVFCLHHLNEAGKTKAFNDAAQTRSPFPLLAHN